MAIGRNSIFFCIGLSLLLFSCATTSAVFKDSGLETQIMLNSKWQFADFSKINSGNAVLYKADKKRKHVTVAVNAGHGTTGGSSVKTFSHPDKSPKVTGGTNAAGAVESIAVSDGMTFKNGKTEAEVNLRTARFFKERLLLAGYDVLMIRDSDDTQLDNIARTVIANNAADIHIAIHFDGDYEKEGQGRVLLLDSGGDKIASKRKKTLAGKRATGNMSCAWT